MVTHRLSYFSYAFFFVGQLNVLAYLLFFFTGQLNVLAYHHHFFCRPTQCVGLSWLQPDGSHRLLLLAFPHAREILLEMLAIDSNRKLDTVWFLKHVCIPRQDLINLVRPMPSWRPFTKLFIFSSQRQYCLPNQVSHLEILRLDLLVVCTGDF